MGGSGPHMRGVLSNNERDHIFARVSGLGGGSRPAGIPSRVVSGIAAQLVRLVRGPPPDALGLSIANT